jgi:hypothetical protein
VVARLQCQKIAGDGYPGFDLDVWSAATSQPVQDGCQAHAKILEQLVDDCTGESEFKILCSAKYGPMLLQTENQKQCTTLATTLTEVVHTFTFGQQATFECTPNHFLTTSLTGCEDETEVLGKLIDDLQAGKIGECNLAAAGQGHADEDTVADVTAAANAGFSIEDVVDEKSGMQLTFPVSAKDCYVQTESGNILSLHAAAAALIDHSTLQWDQIIHIDVRCSADNSNRARRLHHNRRQELQSNIIIRAFVDDASFASDLALQLLLASQTTEGIQMPAALDNRNVSEAQNNPIKCNGVELLQPKWTTATSTATTTVTTTLTTTPTTTTPTSTPVVGRVECHPIVWGSTLLSATSNCEQQARFLSEMVTACDHGEDKEGSGSESGSDELTFSGDAIGETSVGAPVQCKLDYAGEEVLWSHDCEGLTEGVLGGIVEREGPGPWQPNVADGLAVQCTMDGFLKMHSDVECPATISALNTAVEAYAADGSLFCHPTTPTTSATSTPTTSSSATSTVTTTPTSTPTVGEDPLESGSGDVAEAATMDDTVDDAGISSFVIVIIVVFLIVLVAGAFYHHHHRSKSNAIMDSTSATKNVKRVSTPVKVHPGPSPSTATSKPGPKAAAPNKPGPKQATVRVEGGAGGEPTRQDVTPPPKYDGIVGGELQAAAAAAASADLDDSVTSDIITPFPRAAAAADAAPPTPVLPRAQIMQQRMSSVLSPDWEGSVPKAEESGRSSMQHMFNTEAKVNASVAGARRSKGATPPPPPGAHLWNQRRQTMGAPPSPPGAASSRRSTPEDNTLLELPKLIESPQHDASDDAAVVDAAADWATPARTPPTMVPNAGRTPPTTMPGSSAASTVSTPPPSKGPSLPTPPQMMPGSFSNSSLARTAPAMMPSFRKSSSPARTPPQMMPDSSNTSLNRSPPTMPMTTTRTPPMLFPQGEDEHIMGEGDADQSDA